MTLGVLSGVVLGVLFFSNTQYWLINRKIYSKMYDDSCSYAEAVKELALGYPYTIGQHTSYRNSQLRKKMVKARVISGYVLCLLLLVLYIVVCLSPYSVYLEIEL